MKSPHLGFNEERGGCYHGNIVVALDDLPDLPHLFLHVARPDLTDHLAGVLQSGRHVCRFLGDPTVLQGVKGGGAGRGAVQWKKNWGRRCQKKLNYLYYKTESSQESSKSQLNALKSVNKSLLTFLKKLNPSSHDGMDSQIQWSVVKCGFCCAAASSLRLCFHVSQHHFEPKCIP